MVIVPLILVVAFIVNFGNENKLGGRGGGELPCEVVWAERGSRSPNKPPGTVELQN